MKNITMLAACAATTAAVQAVPQIRITEFMYTGLFGEYVEIANIGDTDQNITGWSFSDNSRIVGDTSLSEIGTLSPGEAAIITEVSDALFTLVSYTEPGEPALPTSNIIANNTSNLGRSDEINIYPNGAFDGDNDYEDRVTYNDQGSGTVDGVRADNISAKAGSVGANNFATWVLHANFVGGVWIPNGIA